MNYNETYSVMRTISERSRLKSFIVPLALENKNGSKIIVLMYFSFIELFDNTVMTVKRSSNVLMASNTIFYILGAPKAFLAHSRKISHVYSYIK